MTAIIGYDNLIARADSLTASGEQSGFEVANIADWRTFNAWKGAATTFTTVLATFNPAVTANCFAVFGHNFLDNDNIAVSWWDGGAWQPASFLIVGPLEGVYFRKFVSEHSSTQWRFEVTMAGSDPAMVSNWFLGKFLEFRTPNIPFSPAIYHDTTRYYPHVSETGHWLGNTYARASNMTRIKARWLTPPGVQNDWKAFLDHGNRYPFYYSWNYEDAPEEAAYCWTMRNQNLTAQYYRLPNYVEVTGRLEARIR